MKCIKSITLTCSTWNRTIAICNPIEEGATRREHPSPWTGDVICKSTNYNKQRKETLSYNLADKWSEKVRILGPGLVSKIWQAWKHSTTNKPRANFAILVTYEPPPPPPVSTDNEERQSGAMESNRRRYGSQPTVRCYESICKFHTPNGR